MDDGRARRRRARGAPGGRRCARSSSTSIPEYQNPTGRTLPLERRARARRAVPAPRRADLRGRRLPRAGLRRHVAAVAVVARRRTSCCRPGRSRRGSSPACGSAGPPARRRSSPQLAAAKQNTDQCAGGARAAAGRGVRPRRRLRAPPPARRARCTRRTGRRCRRRCARTCPTAVAWTEPAGGFLTWLELPERARRARPAPAAASRPAWPTSRARRSTSATAAPTTLRLSFSAPDRGRARDAVERLACVVGAALEQAEAGSPARPV